MTKAVEVITSVQRRRRWSRVEKERIVVAIAVPYVVLVVFVVSPRSDLIAKVSDPQFVIEQIAALATGIASPRRAARRRSSSSDEPQTRRLFG
jgi:hypothetical protein